MDDPGSNFVIYEQHIDAVGALHPKMPRTTIVRTRLLYQVLRLFSEDIEQFFTQFGVSASAWAVLMMIYSQPERRANPSLLSEYLVQSRTHMTRVADELVGKQFLRREPNATDRRRIDLVLTDEGTALVRHVMPLSWEHFETMFGDFNDQESQQLEALMRKLFASLHRARAAARQGSAASTQESADE